MKKSQLYSQIFIYVLTIVLISLILVYGYNAVRNFKERGEQVCKLKLKNELQNSIKSISSDFGTVRRKDIQLCENYNEVCFVETFEKIDNKRNPLSNVPITDPIIIDSINSYTNKNTFLVDKIAKESFYAGNISVELDVLCIEAKNNRLSLRLEGKGSHVLLGKWE